MKKLTFVIILLCVLCVSLTSCSDADIASSNLSKAADSFEVNRRIVFYNGITSDYILVIEGLCSLGNSDMSGEISVTCKTGAGQASPYFYRVIFKPSVIIPNIDLQVP
jgi:hypothetical protein